jgi:hypothetical protein
VLCGIFGGGGDLEGTEITWEEACTRSGEKVNALTNGDLKVGKVLIWFNFDRTESVAATYKI